MQNNVPFLNIEYFIHAIANIILGSHNDLVGFLLVVWDAIKAVAFGLSIILIIADL